MIEQSKNWKIEYYFRILEGNNEKEGANKCSKESTVGKPKVGNRREVDLVHVLPFVSEVFFFRKVMSDQCWKSCCTLSDGKRNK